MAATVPLILPTLGVPELLIILVIVLVLFGAGKLPQIGDALGSGIRNFRKAMSEGEHEDDAPRELEDLSIEPDDAPPTRRAEPVARKEKDGE